MGLVPDHDNKVNITIKQVTQILWFPSAYKSYAWDFPGGPVVKTALPLQGGTGSISGRGTKILHAIRCGKKKKKVCSH